MTELFNWSKPTVIISKSSYRDCTLLQAVTFRFNSDKYKPYVLFHLISSVFAIESTFIVVKRLRDNIQKMKCYVISKQWRNDRFSGKIRSQLTVKVILYVCLCFSKAGDSFYLYGYVTCMGEKYCEQQKNLVINCGQLLTCPAVNNTPLCPETQLVHTRVRLSALCHLIQINVTKWPER